jgi:hypothetical protein
LSALSVENNLLTYTVHNLIFSTTSLPQLVVCTSQCLSAYSFILLTTQNSPYMACHTPLDLRPTVVYLSALLGETSTDNGNIMNCSELTEPCTVPCKKCGCQCHWTVQWPFGALTITKFILQILVVPFLF